MPAGRQRALTVDRIIDAVLEDGLATFSMPSIGRRLGVAHSGLYKYVPDRQSLVVLALDRIIKEASWPLPSLLWRDQLSGIGETFWTICTAHPGYAATALATGRAPTGFLEAMTPHVESMHAQGFDLVDAIAAVELVAAITLSCSIASRPHLRDGSENHQRNVDVCLDGLEARLTRHGG